MEEVVQDAQQAEQVNAHQSGVEQVEDLFPAGDGKDQVDEETEHRGGVQRAHQPIRGQRTHPRPRHAVQKVLVLVRGEQRRLRVGQDKQKNDEKRP